MSDSRSSDPASRFHYVPEPLAPALAQGRAHGRAPERVAERTPERVSERAPGRAVMWGAVVGTLVAAIWMIRAAGPAQATAILPEPAFVAMPAPKSLPDPDGRFDRIERELARIEEAMHAARVVAPVAPVAPAAAPAPAIAPAVEPQFGQDVAAAAAEAKGLRTDLDALRKSVEALREYLKQIEDSLAGVDASTSNAEVLEKRLAGMQAERVRP